MIRRKTQEEIKLLEVDATMQGALTFRDPVNLRINGSFEGTLNAKGSLTISENAVVRAEIKGEYIVVAGRVYGNIVAEKELRLIPPCCVIGNVTTPRLSVVEGAILDGECHMTSEEEGSEDTKRNMMTAEELAKYLEVDASMIFEWANSGKLPGVKEKDAWIFDRTTVDEWIASGKVK